MEREEALIDEPLNTDPLPARPRSLPLASGGGGRRAFTLVELLVTLAILALLLAIVLPALSSTIRSARGFRCQMSLRSIAFDFSVFADDQLHGDRGSDTQLGSARFRIETFQESQYGLDEFWRWGNVQTYSLPDPANNDPMRCSEIRGPITLRRNTPCLSNMAIMPLRNISYGFNLRLQRAERLDSQGLPVAPSVLLTSRIMESPNVPLAWDVDGAEAQARGTTPVFSAPSLDSLGPFANDQFWYPATRHNGATNFAFVGGHVLSSRRPLEESGWLWSFQPGP